MRYQLLLFKSSSSAMDITSMCTQIKWSGRKGSSARSLKARVIDDDGSKHERTGIDIDEGNQVIFYVDKKEVFRGVIMNMSQSNKKILTFTAYDNGIYLANNKDTFTYENVTATDVFKDVCSRFGIPTDKVASCSYLIPTLVKSKTSGFDAIADALSLDFDNTNVRHYVSSSQGKLSLLTRKENVLQWVIEPESNLITYTRTRSIENVKTRIKLVSSEGTTLAEESDPSREAKIGAFQDVEVPDESLTTAQITALAKALLKSKKETEDTIDVEVLGIPDVISGIAVYVIINHLGLSQTFYVDSDTHTFEGNKYTMNLKLNVASDIGAEEETTTTSTPAPKKDAKVGDIVTFSGGVHYYTSMDTVPRGGTRTGGKAYVEAVSNNLHKYALIGGMYRSDVPGDSNVYGWVDASTVS